MGVGSLIARRTRLESEPESDHVALRSGEGDAPPSEPLRNGICDPKSVGREADVGGGMLGDDDDAEDRRFPLLTVRKEDMDGEVTNSLKAPPSPPDCLR